MEGEAKSEKGELIIISNDKYIALSARIFCFFAIGAALWIALEYASGALATLIALFAVSSAVNCGAERFAKLTKAPKRLCAVLLVAALFLFAGTAVAFLSARFIHELEELSLWISENRDEIVLTLEDILEGVVSTLDRLNVTADATGLPEYVGELAVSLMNKALSLCLGAVGKPLGALVGKAPAALFLAFVLIVSTVWLSVDYDRICNEIGRLLPRELSHKIEPIRKRLLHTVYAYLRVYALLFLLTLGIAYIGLLILRAPYALIISLVVATVDVLPMLGAGAVLIPLAIGSIVTGSTGLGVGILVLCGVIVIVRQIAEPHIVGQRLGIHPFLSFVSMLLGLYLFGALGALLAPLVFALIYEFKQHKN